MAGSYQHLRAEDGSFTMERIENMGDAHEALEDCFNIIQSLRTVNIPPEDPFDLIVPPGATGATRELIPGAKVRKTTYRLMDRGLDTDGYPPQDWAVPACPSCVKQQVDIRRWLRKYTVGTRLFCACGRQFVLMNRHEVEMLEATP
jgi:hypothetical protein